jgi:protein-S-isoprenylcysteine O-methyltransferase Ste14
MNATRLFHERTYFYPAESPSWLGAAGFLIELIGLSISLIARLQLGRYGTPHLALQEQQSVVQNGLYRRVRHPLYAGELLSSLAWPIIYRAPVTFVATAIVRVLMLRRRIRVEEVMMLEGFGAEYEAYTQRTSRLIPGVY